jgi:hypothetical protein
MTTIKAYNVDTRDFEYVKQNNTGLLISGGGGSTGSASSANQLLQITEAETTNSKLTTINSNILLVKTDLQASLIVQEAINQKIDTRVIKCDTDNISGEVTIDSSTPVQTVGLAKVYNTLNNTFLTTDQDQALRVNVMNQSSTAGLALETTLSNVKSAVDASNIAIYNQLEIQTDRLLYDTDIIANTLTDSNIAVCSRLDTIDVSANNMEVQLDKLQFTSGNLHVRDDNATSELNFIGEITEDLLLSVDGISAKMNALQIQSAKYTIEAVSQFAPDTTPSYSTVAGIPKDQGWYYKNLLNGQVSQLYFYSYLNPAMSVAGRQFAYQLNDITMSYCVVRMIAVNSAEGLPTLAIYTRPTGSGDAVPGFIKSRKVYNIPTSAKLTQGMEVMLYWGVEPSLKLHPGIARIPLQLVSTIGPAVGTEQLAFLSLQTDSATLAGNAEYIVSHAGFQYGAELIMDTQFTGESSTQSVGGDASASNQISSNTAVCSRLDSSTGELSNIRVLLSDSINVINYGLLNDTPQYIPIRASSTGNLFVYDSQTHSELLTLNAEIDGVIDDSAGALKVVGDFYQASQPVEFTTAQDVNLYAGAPLTHTQTGASQYSLDVNVNNASIPVTGEFWQSTQPVSIAQMGFTAEDELIVYDDYSFQELQSLNGKVVLCDTGNVVISGTVPISSASALSVTETTPITGFALESTLDDVKTQTDKLTFIDIDTNTNNLKVIDTALNAQLGQFSFFTGDDEITDLRVRVMNTNLDIGNFPETQPVSIASTIDTSITNTSLDVHCFGSSDGTTFHHLKTTNQGVLITHSETRDGTGNLITSTAVSGTETYRALDVACRGITSISGGVSATLETSANGPLTSTLSGTGNSINSLDVSITNTPTVSGIVKTQAQDSNNTQVANNVSVTGPSRVGNADADTQGYLWVSAIFQFSSVTTGGQIYLEVSHDGNIWARPSSASVFVMTSVVQTTGSIILSTPTPFRYVRLWADTGFVGLGCSAWIVQK